MPHAAARRSGLAHDECRDGLADVLLDEGGGLLLLGAADLADHHDGFGLRVVVEHREDVHESGAGDGVAANADARGLSDASLRELVNALVGQRPTARDDTDLARQVDVAGHDADLRLRAGGDQAGAVRAEQANRLALKVPHHHRGIPHGDALRDADDERDARVRRFQDGVCRERRGHEDQGDVRARAAHGLAHAVEDGNAVQNGLAALARRDSRYEVGPIRFAAFRVEAALTSRDALHQQARVLVHQDTHRCRSAIP